MPRRWQQVPGEAGRRPGREADAWKRLGPRADAHGGRRRGGRRLLTATFWVARLCVCVCVRVWAACVAEFGRSFDRVSMCWYPQNIYIYIYIYIYM